MNQENSRKELEQKLKREIRYAEETAFRDPKLKDMVESLRKLYLNNKHDFLATLGIASTPAPQPTSRKRPVPPPSRIPQLLMILDSVTKKPQNLTQNPQNTPSLLNPVPLDVMTESMPSDNYRANQFQLSAEERQKELEKIQNKIDSTKALFWKIKQDEKAIRSRKGKYSIATERLKAERLLRELPGKITQLIKYKMEIEEST